MALADTGGAVCAFLNLPQGQHRHDDDRVQDQPARRRPRGRHGDGPLDAAARRTDRDRRRDRASHRPARRQDDPDPGRAHMSSTSSVDQPNPRAPIPRPFSGVVVLAEAVALDRLGQRADDPLGGLLVAEVAHGRHEQPRGVHPRRPAPGAEAVEARVEGRLAARDARDADRRGEPALVEQVLLDEAAAHVLGQTREGRAAPARSTSPPAPAARPRRRGRGTGRYRGRGSARAARARCARRARRTRGRPPCGRRRAATARRRR